jgi:hypothetical protein
VKAEQVGSAEQAGTRAAFWKLHMGKAWTVPVVELTRGAPKGTAILLNDAGRRADPVTAERLLAAGQRVLAVDPFYFGESKIAARDMLFALLVASVGERPLGIQASQLAAVARWSAGQHQGGPVAVVSVGPRTSVMALAAAALEEKAIGRLELHGTLGSLKEVIEQNRSVDQMPELFCFGLLEACDLKQLAALVAPRPVDVIAASARVKTEFAELGDWYAAFGVKHELLK